MFAEPRTPVTSHPSASKRPTLYRSRSHTDPTKSGNLATRLEEAEARARATRPQHTRSRSYISPVESKHESKPRSHPVASSALEKTALRLHLPGSSHKHKDKEKEKDHSSSHHRHSQSHTNLSLHNNDSSHSLPFRRHRPTQSEAQAPRRFASKENLANLPHLVAGLNAERERRTQQGNHYNISNPTSLTGTTTSAQAQHTFGPSAAQPKDFEPGGRYDQTSSNAYPELRRRATSDPSTRDAIPTLRAIQTPLRPKTSFEELLERGANARVARRIHVRLEQIHALDRDLATGEEELRSWVAEITATGVEITRRLDYGYYNLLEKIGNLVSIIGSFQSLAKQSETLISNFERESDRIDADTLRRIETFRTGFTTRHEKAQTLASRSFAASQKATSLSMRLEAARQKVLDFEAREDKMRRVWDRVWGICWWCVISTVSTSFPTAFHAVICP